VHKNLLGLYKQAAAHGHPASLEIGEHIGMLIQVDEYIDHLSFFIISAIVLLSSPSFLLVRQFFS
jgi:hypothetical protein